MRGPLVYACESVDNPEGIANMMIDVAEKFELVPAEGLPDGVMAVRGTAFYEVPPSDALYFTETPETVKGSFTAIPYYLWQNRGSANMAVWIRYRGNIKTPQNC